MSLKSMLGNTKNKVKDNLPVIVTSVAAIGSAAVVVYTTRKISITLEDVFPSPRKSDFSIHLSGREFGKLKSGIPRVTGFEDEGVEVVVATKDMLKENFQEMLAKTIFKDI